MTTSRARLNGRTIGIWSLRIDAIYCAILGAAVAVFAQTIARSIALPALVIAVAGVTVMVWAGLVLWMVLKLRIGVALRLVMGVNILAALLVAVSAATAGTMFAAIAVLAIACDVALFAVSQAIALRRMDQARPSLAA